MDKKSRLKELYNKYVDKFCSYEVVLGDGNVNSKLMLIGEAPGKDEVRLGKPFVGKAGKKLSYFLDFINVKREDIYISNAIKYRLSKKSPKTNRLINRPALKKDITNNREYLIEEINIINPKIIVTLGNVPLKSLINNNVSVGDYHGQITFLGNKPFILFPLYHPASLIYNRSLEDIYMKDLDKLKELITP